MNTGQLVGILALVFSLYILWQIRQVLLLLFAAVVLATALNKLARRLRRLGVPRSGSALLAVSIFVALLVGFFLLIVPPFTAQYHELITTKLPQVLILFESWRIQLKTIVPPGLMQYLPDIKSLSQQLQPWLERLLGGSLVFLSNSLVVIFNLLLLIVFTLMLLAQPLSYRKAFVRLFPAFYRRRVEGILDQCEIALGRWVIGAIISMSVVAILSIFGLSVLNVQPALAQGILAGLLNFIPNIGPTLSVVIPMGIALLDAPWKAGAVLIIYIGIQQFESNFLTPYVMSQQVSLLPVVTLLAQVFFATFFGFLGFLLAIPLTVIGQVWLKEAVIKDILDKWDNKKQMAIELGATHDLLTTTESVQKTSDSSEKKPENQEQPSIQDRNSPP